MRNLTLVSYTACPKCGSGVQRSHIWHCSSNCGWTAKLLQPNKAFRPVFKRDKVHPEAERWPAGTVVRVTFPGNVVSKKNNWRPRKTGGIRSSSDFYDWQDECLREVQAMRLRKELPDAPLLGPFACSMRYYPPAEKFRLDLDNAYTSCLDVLEKAGILRNDYWLFSPDGTRPMEADPDNPRADLVVAPYEPKPGEKPWKPRKRKRQA